MDFKAKFCGNAVSDGLVRSQITSMPNMRRNLSFTITQGSVQFTSCQLDILFAFDCPLEDNPYIILQQRATSCAADGMNWAASSIGAVVVCAPN